MDWIRELDLQQALHNCRNDMAGDWYRDPWAWPELDWVANNQPELVVPRLNGSGARRVAKIDVAKENFGIRPAVVLDPIDRLIYQALVDKLSVQLAPDMPQWLFGWRLPRHQENNPGVYARNDREWLALIARLKRLSSRHKHLLKTDVVSFFASIQIPQLTERIFELAGRTPATDRLASMLRFWNETPERTGLPQRSGASAALANLYLESVDQLIIHYQNRYAPQVTSKAARWMDDIWLFGDDESRMRGIQVELQGVLRSIGLELNIAKTEFLSGREVSEEIDQLDLTGLDYLLSLEPPEASALRDFDALIEQLMERPERTNRTTIRFITTRMRIHGLYRKVPEFVKRIPRMPHGADSLARLFRDAGEADDLVDWYIDYATGPWGKIDWAVAQLGTMFDTSHRMPVALEEYFSQIVNSGRSLALTALASQRLAASQLGDSRYTLREAAGYSDNPMHRRVLALAALQAGESRVVVKRILSEFEENAVTLEMLEDRGFRSPKPAADFVGQRRKPR